MTTVKGLVSPRMIQQDGVPWSERFGDTYFDKTDGLAESRHVFLAGCGLPDAWVSRDQFVIGELGFGTGLNFLATWNLWRQTGRPKARLHYVSIEGFPLTGPEIGRCLSRWTELSSLQTQLARAYGEPQRGFRRLFFDDSALVLTLIVDDVVAALRDLHACADAWYLDGFSPRKTLRCGSRLS